MTYTPEQLVKIRQKEAQTPDGLKRDSNVDYYHGWFFVTLNTRDDVPVLSWCEGDVEKSYGEPEAPRCVYTDIGKGVLEAWKRNETVYPDVVVDMAEAMPDHFHGLIHLLPENKRHLGTIIKGFMIGCSHAYWDAIGVRWREMGYVKGVRTPQYEDRDHTKSYRGPALFVHGYNDMEPITEEEVEVKRAYIRDQAKKRLIQGEHHECFRKYRLQHSKNWTVERCMTAIAVDRTFSHDPVKLERAMQNVLTLLNGDTPFNADNSNAGSSLEVKSVTVLPSGKQVAMPAIGIDHVGNKTLLYSKKKLSLVCHSADAGRFEEQKEAVLDAARKGWIIVSAFISPKERDIRQQLMVEGLPFIEITDNGFSDKYKGTGKTFYALAEGRLCQITPWSYLYKRNTPVADDQKKAATISREMCLVMNELARIISGREDDWWKTWKEGK